MAARESEHHVVDFFSADSANRGEVLERDSPPFQQTFQPPPPVGLSLRTRESSALALKHIFDQIYSSAESNPNKNNNNIVNDKANERRESSELQTFIKDGSNAAVYQSGRNHEVPPSWQSSHFPEDHKTFLPETETSFGKVKPQIYSMHDLVLGGSSSASPSGQMGHLPLSHTSLPQAVTRPSPPRASTKQATAQLTIFYSGTVNVYDDVPADKANAIMLLAGTGIPSSMINSGGADKQCAPTKLKSSPSPLHLAPAAAAIALGGSAGANATPASNSKATSFNMLAASNNVNNSAFISNNVNNSAFISTLSSPASGSPTPLAMEPKSQCMPKRPHAGIELPHARKASLARFLEKRKDRVKPQNPEASPLEEGGEIGRDERPSSPKKPCLAGAGLSSPALNQ